MNQLGRVIDDTDPNAITIDDAKARILSVLKSPTEQESLLLKDALGRYMSQQVNAAVDVPSFRASAMDGYAVRVSDCSQSLRIQGQSLAGHPGSDELPAHTAQRITTGARVPDSADAVVQQENVTVENDSILVNVVPQQGQHVRVPGSDVAAGSTLMQIGDRIGPAALALLAAHGITVVHVQRRLKIALFSTGDELVNAGTDLGPGQIYDSNRALLLSMLDDKAIETYDLGIIADSKQAVRDVFDAAKGADLIISSGGVSVGDADFVKDVLSEKGKLNLWKVAMKPGRPLTFGELGNNRAFFGLPGNPVSAALTCLLFVKPALKFMCRSPITAIPTLSLPLQGKLTKNPGRVEYQRAIMVMDNDGHQSVTTTGVQDSHVLMSLHKANCLIELPLNSRGAENGELVTVIPFNHFGTSPL